MKIISALSVFCILAASYTTHAQHGRGTHGGGYISHSSARSSGGFRSGGRSSFSGSRPQARGSAFSGHNTARAAGPSRQSGPAISRRGTGSLSGPSAAARGTSSNIVGPRGYTPTHVTGNITNHSSAAGGNTVPEYRNTGGGYYYATVNPERRAYYDYYYHNYYYPYYYSPYPYMGMWSFGYGMLYTPHYNNTAPVNNSDQAEEITMDGYVVYEHDTIPGRVTLSPRLILVSAKDSGQNYNYRFKTKQDGLESVTLYNTDNKELSLTHIPKEPKKLWRVVHEGKLNIYDDRKGFIYSPEDIDRKSLKVVYNGVTASLGYHSAEDSKVRLTEYVNKAYALNLRPADYTWKELLIYIDKLD